MWKPGASPVLVTWPLAAKLSTSPAKSSETAFSIPPTSFKMIFEFLTTVDLILCNASRTTFWLKACWYHTNGVVLQSPDQCLSSHLWSRTSVPAQIVALVPPALVRCPYGICKLLLSARCSSYLPHTKNCNVHVQEQFLPYNRQATKHYNPQIGSELYIYTI